MSAEWNKIALRVDGKTSLPLVSDADKFGHVIWFNPTTGTIVDKWDKMSSHYTHWRKTDIPDVIGDEFVKWLKDKYPGLVIDENRKFDRDKLELAFRAGAAAALK